MIERFYPYFTPECDYCGKRLPGEMSFRDALRAMWDAGWESRGRDGERLCVCNDCLFEEKGYGNEPQ